MCRMERKVIVDRADEVSFFKEMIPELSHEKNLVMQRSRGRSSFELRSD